MHQNLTHGVLTPLLTHEMMTIVTVAYRVRHPLSGPWDGLKLR